MAVYENIPDAVEPNFTFSPVLGKPGVTIQFMDLSGNVTDNAPVKYEWDWGDGSTWGSGANPTHIFSRSGNFTVTLWTTGTLNKTRSGKALVVPIGAAESATQCDSSVGDTTGIIKMGSPISEIWSGIGTPQMKCINPYLCTCEPNYAKYQCQVIGGNGSQQLIRKMHPDCCKFCGVAPPEEGVIIEQPKTPVFKVVSVDVTPPNPGRTEQITAVAHISNTGTAAGAAVVLFQWEDGTTFGNRKTTDIINVNSTVASPPVIGYAPGEGTHKLCAVILG